MKTYKSLYQIIIRVFCVYLISIGMLTWSNKTYAACTTGACVSAGPRLASVSTTRSALLNPLLGGLLGTNLNLTVTDWNTIAQGNVNLLSYLNVLQTATNVSTPSQALTANATVLQAIASLQAAAQAEANVSLANALAALTSQLSGIGGSIKVGDLLQVTIPPGSLSSGKVNALDFLTGIIQLYNKNNVLTTPTPISITGSALGLTGILQGVSLSAQVIEPPVYICGPSGTQFYSAAIRVKLAMSLINLTPDAGLLNLLAGVANASIVVGNIELYAEVARASGTITSIDAVNSIVNLNATPSVTGLYLGHFADNVFFNRSHTLVPADLDYSTVGGLSLNGLTVAIDIKSAITGQAPLGGSLSFNGPFPQTKTVGTSSTFIVSILNSLITNLSIRVTPSLGFILDGLVLPVLKGIITGVISPILSTILASLVDPLLELLGIGLGEMDVTVNGVCRACALAGLVYQDANHNSQRDSTETGTGATVYAKLIQSNVVAQTATVNTSTGVYSFASVADGSYSLIVDTANNTNVTPTAPTGWIATEIPTLNRSVTMNGADISNQTFGLYNGSKLSGVVFKDNGIGSGTANNGVKDGTEIAIAASAVKITDNTGATQYDTTTTAADGSYTLWIPNSAGAGPLKISKTNPVGYIGISGAAGNTSGSYTRSTDSISYTNASGTVYTSVNFGAVPDNRFIGDGQQNALPGTVVFFTHDFTAGTVGQVTLTTSQTNQPSQTAWNVVLYLDSNCNAAIDSGETIISASISVIADQKVCVIAKVSVPSNSPMNAQNKAIINATMAYTNALPSYNASYTVNDVTIVGLGDAGLKLTKIVDKSNAKVGDLLTYTITFQNVGTSPIRNLKINDSTPAYTVFNSATCSSTPSGMSCNLTTQPLANNAGGMVWTFSGALNPGTTGNVKFDVLIK